MKNKILSISLFLCVLCLCAVSAKAEARSHFSLNIGALFTPPQPVYQRYVVEHYQPYYAPAPVYVCPAPCAYPAPRPGMYIAPRPVYHEVYVAPQPVYSGASFSWHNFH